MKLWCCQCELDVSARLTDGREIYPHRSNLAGLPFWKCDACGNYVGTHHKTADPTRPLGCIPSSALRAERIAIHALIDPAWRSGRVRRRDLYARLGRVLGREYHTAGLRTIAEARAVYAAARDYLSTL